MPPIQPISLFDIIRPATIGAIVAGLVVVVVLAILAFTANASGSGESNTAVILMIASIMAGVIGIPMGVAITYAALSFRVEETTEVMEMETQPQA